MGNSIDFGEKIFKLRKDKGFTQEDIALELGVSDKAVSKWENGTAKPTINNLKKLSDMLDISLEDLLKEEKENEIKKIYKIVITGGPCSGKTTSLKYLKNQFEKEGYKVIIIPSVSTELIKLGISPYDFKEHLDFESTNLKTQLFLEELIEEKIAKIKQDKILLICERGCMDAKAYCSSKEFNKLLIDFDIAREELINSYDAVFHLVTVAKGFSELYTKEDRIRVFSSLEAVSIDNKILDAWSNHPNVRIINSYKSIDDKMIKLGQEVRAFLNGNDYYKKKYLIKMPSEHDLFSLSGISKTEIYATYINKKNGIKVIRIKVGDSSFFYLVKNTDSGKLSNRISSKKYIELLDKADPNFNRLDKTRYTFVYKNNVIKIDQYSFMRDGDNAIMEIELLSSREKIEIPGFIDVIRDVSDDPKYKKVNMANKNII